MYVYVYRDVYICIYTYRETETQRIVILMHISNTIQITDIGMNTCEDIVCVYM